MAEEEELNEGFGESSEEEEEELEGSLGEEEEEEEEEEAAQDSSFETNADFVALANATKKNIEGKKSESDKKARKKKSSNTGVVYLGHIPHGFYEDQMKGFFSQFGTVTRIKLSRSKKTGRSKGYAFIEFEHKEVAAIVAQTLQGYILFSKRLVSHVVDPEKVHESMFAGCNQKFKTMPWRVIAKKRHNADRTKAQQDKITKKLVKAERKKRKKLKEMGIDYEFKGYEGCVQAKPKRTKFDEDE